MLYHSCIIHKCLYYKHNINVISDQDYDKLERQLCATKEFNMVDFDPRYCRTAQAVDRLPVSKLIDLVELLKDYPHSMDLSVDLKSVTILRCFPSE